LAFGIAGCSWFEPDTGSADPYGHPEGRGAGGRGGNGGGPGIGGSATGGDGNVIGPNTNAVVNDYCTTDPNDTVHAPCRQWLKVELPGTICGDGSTYKFFVNYSNTSNDVVVSFEPGGACWDYASCTGQNGVRGAANPHGIPDDHMTEYQFLPLVARTDQNPVKDWNMVFVSYCTGDIHTGNNAMTYSSSGTPGGPALDAGAPGNAPDGGSFLPAGADAAAPSVLFHHAGHANTLAIVEWMSETFKGVPKLLVTGCSAGGAGALLNYHFVRRGLGAAVDRGYLLDDSGPIFHGDGPSKQLQEKVRVSWNVDPVLESMTGLPVDITALEADFGLINTALADEFPDDRLALTAYRMDLDYSLYSYQRFFSNPTEAEIHALWWEDLQELMTSYDSRKNLSYFLPYFRSDNCSHCVTIPPIGNPPIEPLDAVKATTTPWLGSEIAQDHIDVHRYVQMLLDDSSPLESYVESPQPNESFSPAVSAQCMRTGG
jgi:hypothetical protein